MSERRRVRVSAGELAVLELGDPADPAVVLLHGFASSSHLWRNVAPLLAPWMRVIAPDLLGAGGSDKPADAELGLVAQTGYVHELLDGLGVERFAAVGHGFGGGIAQRLALEADVPAMVLIDSVAFGDWPSEVTVEAQIEAPAAGPAIAQAMLRTAFELGMGHRSRLSDADLQVYLDAYGGEEGSAALFRLLRAIDGRGLLGLEERLAALEIPVLILWGEDDPYLPSSIAERLADLFPRASAALLPGCSHFLPEDAPETLAPLLFEYLRSQYLGTPHRHEEPGGPVRIELGRPPGGEERPA